MEIAKLLFAAGLAMVAVAALLQLVWGYLNIPKLADVPPLGVRGASSRVSVIVAARDEERHIEAAARGLLAQSYPALEVVVVDDRSTDRTAEILNRLQQEDRRLRVLRVRELPAGWLGKNYALQTGAQSATGELLLFADADVIMRPLSVSRAVRLMELERADHVTIAPDLILPTWPLALVVNYFMMWFLLWLRPWKSRDPRSAAYIGIGAFNLVRSQAYRSVGGHTRIALRPDDDLMLGKLLKNAGYRQLVASGGQEVIVEWYRDLRELARGFRKNAFAGMRYSALFTLLTMLGNVTLGIWPFIAVWLSVGLERSLYATAALAQMLAYAGPALMQRTRPWLALLYPVAAAIFIWILGAAVFRTLRRRGIEWRGTHYALDELRANRV
jgi:cellulose synthase/poly-beta-1,6-N-acetylglucosamine synthase-like glycosyltransferase